MFGPVSHPICPCGPMTIPVRPIGPPEQGFSSIGHPRFPGVVPPYLQTQCIPNLQNTPFGPVPPGMVALPNFGCQCPKMRINDPLYRTQQRICPKYTGMQPILQNKEQKEKTNFGFYVQLDEVSINNSQQNVSKINYCAPKSGVRYDDVKDKIFWLFNKDMPGPKPDDVICGVPKNRDVRQRKATGAVPNTLSLKKQLLAKLKENDANINEFSFVLPEGIREPREGDMISWQGVSSDGPQPGVRAIWHAEKMKDEPGKICWLGREVTDMETESVFRHDLKSSKPEQNVWKSRVGVCLPPIASNQQKPIKISEKPVVPDAESSPKDKPLETEPTSDDDLPTSISATNIPSEFFKTVSWQDGIKFD